jgi:multidrug efflux pump subunit AcrB
MQIAVHASGLGKQYRIRAGGRHNTLRDAVVAGLNLNIFHKQAISSAEELAQVPLEGQDGERVTLNGEPVLLGDVTDVVENHQPLIGDTACGGGGQCLLVVVEKFPGANTVEVTAGVDKALAALRPGLADMQIDSSVYRPADYVDDAKSNLGWALLAGFVLLLLVLLGLSGWRRALVTATTVATSGGLALLVLQMTSTSLNLLVLTGLVLGLTVLVDDALDAWTFVVGAVAFAEQFFAA